MNYIAPPDWPTALTAHEYRVAIRRATQTPTLWQRIRAALTR